MKKLTVNGIKILKCFHLLFAILWIGGGVALCLILITMDFNTPQTAYTLSKTIKFIDDCIIIPGAVGSFFLGLTYGFFTPWGFFKQRWVTIKWILTIFLILFGTFVLGPYINNNVILCETLKGDVVDNLEYIQNLKNITLYGGIQTILILIFIPISVFKYKFKL